MTKIYYQSLDDNTKEVSLRENESVLNALLRAGVDVPYGCQNGVCQSCIMKTERSSVPRAAQKGLREVQKQQGYFLSCCCKPTESMVVSLSKQFRKEQTVLLDKTMLAPNVIRLRVKKVICYRPGQYVTLWKNEYTARTYSLASHPTQDDFLEFHVRVYPNGVFSTWVANELKVGDTLDVQGPMGDCFYSERDKSRPLFLSGLGTGLAPLYGIVRDALIQGHQGSILLLVGARTEEGVYYKKELSQLQQQFSQLTVRYSVQEMSADLAATNGRESNIYAAAKMLQPDFSSVTAFLCGGASFVTKMRKQCFLEGVNMGDIYSDVFLSFPQK